MATLVNKTKNEIPFFASECNPEEGVIRPGESINVTSENSIIFEVVFGRYGDSNPIIRATDMPQNATVTLSLTVE